MQVSLWRNLNAHCKPAENKTRSSNWRKPTVSFIPGESSIITGATEENHSRKEESSSL